MQHKQLLTNREAREYLNYTFGRDTLYEMGRKYTDLVCQNGSRTLWPITTLDRILQGGISIPRSSKTKKTRR